MILNDLNRTFPAHEYFKDAGGVGQEALYKLSRVCQQKKKKINKIKLCFFLLLLNRLIQYVMKKLDIVKVYHLLLQLYLFMYKQRKDYFIK